MFRQILESLSDQLVAFIGSFRLERIYLHNFLDNLIVFAKGGFVLLVMLLKLV